MTVRFVNGYIESSGFDDYYDYGKVKKILDRIDENFNKKYSSIKEKEEKRKIYENKKKESGNKYRGLPFAYRRYEYLDKTKNVKGKKSLTDSLGHRLYLIKNAINGNPSDLPRRKLNNFERRRLAAKKRSDVILNFLLNKGASYSAAFRYAHMEPKLYKKNISSFLQRLNKRRKLEGNLIERAYDYAQIPYLWNNSKEVVIEKTRLPKMIRYDRKMRKLYGDEWYLKYLKK